MTPALPPRWTLDGTVLRAPSGAPFPLPVTRAEARKLVRLFLRLMRLGLLAGDLAEARGTTLEAQCADVLADALAHGRDESIVGAVLVLVLTTVMWELTWDDTATEVTDA